MSAFENELDRLDSSLASAQKSAAALLAAIRKARAAAQEGRIAEIEKGLPAIRQMASDVAAQGDALAQAWRFDVAAHLGSDAYVAELGAAAAEAGLRMFDRDGKIYAFPLILRIEPREAAVRIGRKLERRVRPRALVEVLGAIQKRPQRFR